MAGFIDFLIDNYLIFLLITLVLIFALIGYLVESKKEAKGEIVKPKTDEEKKQEILDMVKQDSTSQTLAGMKNVSINEAVNDKNKNLASTDVNALEQMDTTPVLDTVSVVEPVVQNTPVEPAISNTENIIGSIPSMNSTPDEELDNLTKK